MTYCPIHKRVLHPAGWSMPVHKYVEDTWGVLFPEVWKWAVLFHMNFPTSVELRETQCDLCVLSHHHHHDLEHAHI